MKKVFPKKLTSFQCFSCMLFEVSIWGSIMLWDIYISMNTCTCVCVFFQWPLHWWPHFPSWINIVPKADLAWPHTHHSHLSIEKWQIYTQAAICQTNNGLNRIVQFVMRVLFFFSWSFTLWIL